MMNTRWIFISSLLSVSSTGLTQAQPQISFTQGVAGTWHADWQGVAGRTYFSQWSTDLETWKYAPLMEFGAGAKSFGMATNGLPKFFTRLNYVDDPSVATLQQAQDADFDLDTLTNWQEVSIYFTGPLTRDTDNDGLSDSEEVWRPFPTNPNMADTDGDGLKDGAEVDLGTDPNNADTDGDGIPDGDEISQGSDPNPAAGIFKWHQVERELNYLMYFHELEGTEPPMGNMRSSVSWMNTPTDSVIINQQSEDMGPGFPTTGLRDRLDEAQQFPTTPPSAQQGLELLPSTEPEDTSTWHSNGDTSFTALYGGDPLFIKLSQSRFWLRREQATSAVVKRLVLMVTKRYFHAYSSIPDTPPTVPVFTVKAEEITIPANQTTSNPIDLDAGFTIDLPSYNSQILNEGNWPHEYVGQNLVEVEFITPAGNPVTAPVDAGTSSNTPDGANEFTFSTASSGVLTIKLKAKVLGVSALPVVEQNKLTFDVDSIGNATLAWDASNPGGKVTVEGDFITATVTYTGLPQNNSDFGLKTARVKFGGNKSGETKFEVFFPKDEKNHPGDGAGTTPNWYYYWKDALAFTDIEYKGAGPLYGQVPGMLGWSYLISRNKVIVYIYDLAATVDPGDPNADKGAIKTTGIDAFLDTVLHEKRHVSQIAVADPLVNSSPDTPWKHGWSWNQRGQHNHWTVGSDSKPGIGGVDDDSDGLIDNLSSQGPGELGKGDDHLLDNGTNQGWPNAWGTMPPQPWAGGSAIEDPAYNTEPDNEHGQKSKDWGNPGKQHKTLNKYDD